MIDKGFCRDSPNMYRCLGKVPQQVSGHVFCVPFDVCKWNQFLSFNESDGHTPSSAVWRSPSAGWGSFVSYHDLPFHLLSWTSRSLWEYQHDSQLYTLIISQGSSRNCSFILPFQTRCREPFFLYFFLSPHGDSNPQKECGCSSWTKHLAIVWSVHCRYGVVDASTYLLCVMWWLRCMPAFVHTKSE